MGGKKLSRTEMINTKFCYQNAVSRGVCVCVINPVGVQGQLKVKKPKVVYQINRVKKKTHVIISTDTNRISI